MASYLNELGSTNAGLYQALGRGFPDVSAQGVNYEIVLNGSTTTVAGTSASTPVFASVIALLNDRLIAVSGLSGLYYS